MNRSASSKLLCSLSTIAGPMDKDREQPDTTVFPAGARAAAPSPRHNDNGHSVRGVFSGDSPNIALSCDRPKSGARYDMRPNADDNLSKHLAFSSGIGSCDFLSLCIGPCGIQFGGCEGCGAAHRPHGTYTPTYGRRDAFFCRTRDTRALPPRPSGAWVDVVSFPDKMWIFIILAMGTHSDSTVIRQFALNIADFLVPAPVNIGWRSQKGQWNPEPQ